MVGGFEVVIGIKKGCGHVLDESVFEVSYQLHNKSSRAVGWRPGPGQRTDLPLPCCSFFHLKILFMRLPICKLSFRAFEFRQVPEEWVTLRTSLPLGSDLKLGPI
jgi:hypothetical protein